MIEKAIIAINPNASFSSGENIDRIRWHDGNPLNITKEQIQAKIAELQAAEPLRLLRIQRNQILQQSDWEVQRNQERNITDTALIEYRNALRDLPQKIEAEEIEAPTLSETGELIFEHWPVRGE